jgi:arylsulfatase A-like enzyme
VLLYATCSLNKDFLSPYNPAIGYTPSFERFGSQALVFERHHTEAGQSGTAFASLFAGVQAMHHGIFRHPARLRDELVLVTEAYADAGYDVHAWLEHLMASAALHYAQGVPRDNVHSGRLEARDPAFLEILARLQAEPDYRAFLITNFTVTHGPYQGTLLEEFCDRHPGECTRLDDPLEFERYRELYVTSNLRLSLDFDVSIRELGLNQLDVDRIADVARTLYEADVFLLDRLFGAVVDEIDRRGLQEESLIAFTSDHGEIHYRENAEFRWTHGFQLAPEVLNVALMLRGVGTGIQPGRYEAVTRSIDVFPTLAGLSDLEHSHFEGSGVDLSRVLWGEAPPPELLAFSHTVLYPGPTVDYARFHTLFPANDPTWMWVSVRTGDRVYKRLHLGGGEWESVAFDLDADPSESHDLYDERSEEDRRMMETLKTYKSQLLEAYRSTPRGRRFVPKEREIEMLKALGYIE